MGVCIYSKFDCDKLEFFNEIGEINDEKIDGVDSSSTSYYLKNVSPNCISVPYSYWNTPFRILFDCFKGDKSTFLRDDVGFIPPHILNKIVRSKKFNEHYNESIQNLKRIVGSNSDLDQKTKWDQIIIILKFIIKNKNVGICWS